MSDEQGEMTPSEADAWERSRMTGSAMGGELIGYETDEEPEDDLRSLLNMREEYGSNLDDPELEQLNNPDINALPEPPQLGGRTADSDLWGVAAETAGRISSPKLYAQANGFPSATQYRVWRWENGIPVALGAIDIEASEEDFVERFFHAMPEPGDGRFQYRLRPVDIRGQEMGKEITINISEHHESLVRARKRQSRKDEYRDEQIQGGGGHGPIIVNPAQGGGYDASGALADEMGRMFEHAVESAERRSQMLQESLESERERLKQEEMRRADERVHMATQTSEAVQKMMERLMSSDRQRGNEQLQNQKEQSNMLMSTLTTVFQQQQEAARQQSERMREADMNRLSLDREFFERQRQQQDDMRRMERDEWTRRQESERLRIQQEAERLKSQRQYELEQLRLDSQRREHEMERRRESEKSDLALRLERERAEMEQQRQRMAEERERWRAELEEKRRQEAMEWERKRSVEREEAERRRQSEREDAERRDREARERMERERMEFQQRMEMHKMEMEQRRLSEERRMQQEREAYDRRMQEERREAERREQLRRDELSREADRKREDTQLQMKQMEISAQRDREHQEKLLRMSQMEREAAREMQASREKSEQHARDLAEAERGRQHALMMKEMEMSKERDREHAERMIQLSGGGNSGGGLGGLGEMLGMDTPELLGKIFGGNSGSGWSDAIPKVLGSLAEVSKAALTPGRAPAGPRKKRPQQQQQQQQMVQIMTPEGPRMIPMESARSMGLLPDPAASEAQRAQAVAQQKAIDDIMSEFAEAGDAESAEASGEANQPPATRPLSREEEIQKAFGKDTEESEYDAAGHVNIKEACKAAGLKLVDQKKARKGIRKLVAAMREKPDEEWPDIVMAGILEEPIIFSYIQAVCLYTSLREAGAEKDLSDRIAAALKAHELVPDTLRYVPSDPHEIDDELLDEGEGE
jgi:hypothetical protein